MFVCYLIKSEPCRELAQDAPCQLRDSGTRFLEGRRSPIAALWPKSEMSFVRAPRANTPFLQLLTVPSTTSHWQT